MKNIFSLFVIISLISCKKEAPESCIDIIPLRYEINDEVGFSSVCAKNGHSFLWSFGDGESSEERAVKHTYTSPGTYEVELKTYSKKQKSFDSEIISIVVKPRPNIVTIVYVDLISFSPYDPTGGAWDTDLYPDIKLSVFASDSTYVDGVEVQQNAVYNQLFSYFIDFPAILPYSKEYLIAIWDEDLTSDLLMEFLDFDPSKYSLTEPNYVDVIKGDYTMRLHLEWVY